ncbi:hypothetical protein SUGI_0400770 [Cryptomeria japonica]|nr:hypothetical protein SUGI_0400770 [Cryptomeria japonica]
MKFECFYRVTYHICFAPCKNISRKDVVWKPPPPGWVKMNFDGASKGNPGRAGFGAVIRNEYGKLLWSIASLYGIASNNEAKLKGLEKGLAMCVEKIMEKVVIEGDSQVILNGASKGHFLNWRLQTWMHMIKQLLSSLLAYRMQHTYREGNRATDWLANKGIEGDVIQIKDKCNDWDRPFRDIIFRDEESVVKKGTG